MSAAAVKADGRLAVMAGHRGAVAVIADATVRNAAIVRTQTIIASM